MNIRILGIAIGVSLLLASFSAKAVTFNITTASSEIVENIIYSPINGTLDLLHGEFADDDTSGTMQITVFNYDIGPGARFFSKDITVQSGGETLLLSGDFEVRVYNKVTGSTLLGANSSLRLLSDLIFDFSFGQFTLYSGLMGGVACIVCSPGESRTDNIKLLGTYSEISAVPLPTGLSLMLVGLGLLGLMLRKKR